MPELPEVQTVLNDLEASGLLGRKVEKVICHWPRIVAFPEALVFVASLEKQSFESLSRRGKYLLFGLSKTGFLVVHLRMTGQFHWGTEPKSDPHCHMAFLLDDKRWLLYRDTRKFGRFWLVENPSSVLGHLGMEALSADLTAPWLEKAFSGRKRSIKGLLLDQSIIAGLGNIYVDEALFEARIHPLSPAHSLGRPELERLAQAIQKVLRQGLDNLGTSLGDNQTNFYSVAGRRGRNQDGLKVFRRHGKPCLNCGDIISRLEISQRSTHFCPSCQKASANPDKTP